jgi:dihydroflavonol-4-reductase
MKVLVTGGTGFVGSHSVRALLDVGHAVKLLVRDPARVPFKGLEMARGEVTDANAVAKAIAGCDAVLHCASVYSYDPRKDAEMLRVNVAGTRNVLEAGLAAGCNPVVHVSSLVALIGGTPRGRTLSADSPVGEPLGVYPRTKRDSELIARALQDKGHPVLISYPGSVWGPDDPYFGESAFIAQQIALGKVPLSSRGKFGVVDVRDVAAVHARAMKPHAGPARYGAFGRAVRHCDLHRMVCEAAGVRRVNIALPTPMVLSAVPVFRLLAAAGAHLPNSAEGAYLTWRDHPVDNGASERELGVRFRPVEDSVRDTVAWLGAAGHLRL